MAEIESGPITNLIQIPTRNHNDTQNRNAVAAHPEEAVGVYSASSLFPQDIGKNWKDLGIKKNNYTLLNDVTYLGGGSIVEGSSLLNVGLEVSRDYGMNWGTIDLPLAESGSTPIYCGNGILICNGGFPFKKILRSTDFGQTWVNLGAILTDISESSCYLGNGIVLMADSKGEVFRSTDYGLIWANVASGVGGSPRITRYLGNGIVIIGLGDGNIFRSTDFGASFFNLGVITDGSSIRSAAYMGNGIVVCSSGFHIYRSTDYGLTWIDLGVIVVSRVETLVYGGNGITVGGTQGGHIYRSTDYGQTWTNLGVIATNAIDQMIVFDTGRIIGTCADGSVIVSDVPYKINESQVNFPRLQIDQTASRDLDATYTNNDLTRTLEVSATVRCAITVLGGNAYVQGFSDDATPPVTDASGIVGIQTGLLNENNLFQLVFKVSPGKKYIITTSALNGSVTKGKWFEIFI